MNQDEFYSLDREKIVNKINSYDDDLLFQSIINLRDLGYNISVFTDGTPEEKFNNIKKNCVYSSEYRESYDNIERCKRSRVSASASADDEFTFTNIEKEKQEFINYVKNEKLKNLKDDILLPLLYNMESVFTVESRKPWIDYIPQIVDYYNKKHSKRWNSSIHHLPLFIPSSKECSIIFSYEEKIAPYLNAAVSVIENKDIENKDKKNSFAARMKDIFNEKFQNSHIIFAQDAKNNDGTDIKNTKNILNVKVTGNKLFVTKFSDNYVIEKDISDITKENFGDLTEYFKKKVDNFLQDRKIGEYLAKNSDALFDSFSNFYNDVQRLQNTGKDGDCVPLLVSFNGVSLNDVNGDVVKNNTKEFFQYANSAIIVKNNGKLYCLTTTNASCISVKKDDSILK